MNNSCLFVVTKPQQKRLKKNKKNEYINWRDVVYKFQWKKNDAQTILFKKKMRQKYQYTRYHKHKSVKKSRKRKKKRKS